MYQVMKTQQIAYTDLDFPTIVHMSQGIFHPQSTQLHA